LPEEDKESKTEEPTPKRLEDARKKGRTAKSLEVNTVLILLASLIFFTFLGMIMIKEVLLIWREYFTAAAEYEFNVSSAQHLLLITFRQLIYVIMPFMFALALTGVLSNYWQNDGWLFSWHPLKPQFNKLFLIFFFPFLTQL